MNSTESSTVEKEAVSQETVERLLAEVAAQESAAVVPKGAGPSKGQLNSSIQPHDFRSPVSLAPMELRKLRIEHETFAQALAARLSLHLRLEFGLQVSQIATPTYQRFIDGLANPCHLTLFKIEPLRGICILELNPRLGLTIIDRLMGGPGQAIAPTRDLSEVEMALLDQALLLILNEWCGHWAKVQALRPSLLGHENTGRFLQTSPPDTVMLVLSMEARIGECVEPMQIGFPYSALEPLIRGLQLQHNTKGEETQARMPQVRPAWKSDFDDLPLALEAIWPGIKLTARKLANLKLGDVIPLSPDFSNSVRLRLGGKPRYLGRLGTSDQRWAVELTKPL